MYINVCVCACVRTRIPSCVVPAYNVAPFVAVARAHMSVCVCVCLCVSVCVTQHDASFFDFFLEHQMMEEFGRIMVQETSRRGAVAVQILQTLSIMILNIRSDTLLYYIFSNNHINDLIALPYDFRDEELLAHYVSFLKTLSSKLNERTVQFFFASTSSASASARREVARKASSSSSGHGGSISGSDGGNSNSAETGACFPLFTKAIGLFDHSESMVRAAVRTLTLNVYSVKDETVQEWLATSSACRTYASLLAEYTLLKFRELVELVDVVGPSHARSPGARQGVAPSNGEAALLDTLAEVGDLLYYYNDLLSLRQCKVSMAIARIFWDRVVQPLVIGALAAGEREEDIHRAPLICALYLAARFVDIIKHRVLLSAFAATLLLGPEERRAYTDAMNAETVAGEGTDAADEPERAQGDVRGGRVSEDEEPGVLIRIVDMVNSGDEQIASGALNLLVEMIRSQHISEDILDAAGILPRRRQQKRMLLQGLSSSFDDANDSVREALNGMQIHENGPSAHAGETQEDEEEERAASASAPDQEEDVEPAEIVASAAPSAATVDNDATETTASEEEEAERDPTTGDSGVQSCVVEDSAVTTCTNANGTAVISTGVSPRKSHVRDLLVLNCIGIFDWKRFFMRRAMTSAGWLLLQLLVLPRRTASWDATIAATAAEVLASSAAATLPSSTPPVETSEEAKDGEGQGVVGGATVANASPTESRKSMSKTKLSPEWERKLREFTREADETLLEDTDATWADGLIGLITTEWSAARTALQAPPRADEAGDGILTPCVFFSSGNEGQSASLVHGIKRTVQRVVVLKMLNSMFAGRVPSRTAPLAAHVSAIPASPSVGDEIEMGDGVALPCRVAFERGREMAVYLVAHTSTAKPDVPASSLLLIEPMPSKLGAGTVRAVAPIIASQARTDTRHPEWLHVYVRAPLSSLSSLDKNQRVNGRRLIDGQWTLAFPDEAAGSAALDMVLAHYTRLVSYVRDAVRPLVVAEVREEEK